MDTKKSIPAPPIGMAVAATVLAWIIPGAGHVCLGRVWRGAIIFVVIGATFWGGVAMGGVMTVDPVNERWWYLAEMVTGAHGLAAAAWQKRVYSQVLGKLPPEAWRAPGEVRQAYVDEELAKERLALVAPMDTVARAYSGVAGLLNLMCIFDAAMLALMGIRGELPTPRQGRQEQAT